MVLLHSNYIGVDRSGASALGNFDGVVAEGGVNTIGGLALGNVISGNAVSGIVFDGAAATADSVLGNKIGSNAAGNQSLPNGGPGVYILNGASQNAVGSTVGGGGNLLRANAPPASC